MHSTAEQIKGWENWEKKKIRANGTVLAMTAATSWLSSILLSLSRIAIISAISDSLHLLHASFIVD